MSSENDKLGNFFGLYAASKYGKKGKKKESGGCGAQFFILVLLALSIAFVVYLSFYAQ